MKAAKAVLLWLIIVILLAFAAGAYLYRSGYLGRLLSAPLPPAAQPDNSVMAGKVVKLSQTSLSVQKQNGAVVSINIASSTQLVGGEPFVGLQVLVNPDPAHAGYAQSVIVVSPPPTR